MPIHVHYLGLPGAKGVIGETGEPGVTGINRPPGPQGQVGESGLNGTRGRSGFPGRNVGSWVVVAFIDVHSTNCQLIRQAFGTSLKISAKASDYHNYDNNSERHLVSPSFVLKLGIALRISVYF